MATKVKNDLEAVVLGDEPAVEAAAPEAPKQEVTLIIEDFVPPPSFQDDEPQPSAQTLLEMQMGRATLARKNGTE